MIRADHLTARTVLVAPNEGDSDLLAFAGDDGLLVEQEGRGLAGRGVALRVAAADAEEVLATIRTEDEVGRSGCGPVVMGALPFDPDAPTSLVVPRAILGRTGDGLVFRTTIGPAGEVSSDEDVRPVANPTRHPADSFTLTATIPHREWCAIVAEAVEVIESGKLRKVVVAREIAVEANRPILAVDVLARLRALYPSCLLFSIDGFVGASPELLVSRRGDQVSSHPLAGTIPRSGDPAVDDRLGAALLESAKDREEHALVVDEVAAVLRRHCEVLDVPAGPSIVPLRNVSHLGTRISGRLGEPRPSALALARLLHPTPAVAGTPTTDALAWIHQFERLNRGRFAGPVGWMDARGDGDWAVGIRSAELDGHRARLMAGVGVVADSTPEAELAETQLKLQALLAAIVRP